MPQFPAPIPWQVLNKMPKNQLDTILRNSEKRRSRRQHGRLMHDADIENIVKGQIMQIHTGSAWVDDWYHQNVRLRRNRAPMINEHLRRLHIPVPGLSKNRERKNAEKKELKEKERMEALVNSLGTAMRFVSSKAPRQLLEAPTARRDEDHTDDELSPGMGLDTNSYSLRLTAESCALLLCDVYDLDVVMKTDEVASFIDSLTESREDLIDSIFAQLRIDDEDHDAASDPAGCHRDDFFVSMLLTAKGRAVICRALPLFQPVQIATTLRVVLRNLPLVAQLTERGGKNVSSANWEATIESLASSAQQIDPEALLMLLKQFGQLCSEGPHLATVLSANTTAMLLLCLLQIAHHYSATSSVWADVQATMARMCSIINPAVLCPNGVNVVSFVNQS